MYTNSRQFPHLLNKSEEEIAQIEASSLDHHPLMKSISMMRMLIITLAAAASAYLLRQYAELPWAWILGAVLAGAGLVIVGWHLVWLNWVMFRLTLKEVGGTLDPPTKNGD